MSDTARDAQIGLSSDEAIVLFDLLSRWIDESNAPTPGSDCFAGPAECVVLHGLLASLEKQLVAPFSADYAEAVERAHARLGRGWFGKTLRG
jgi:hypothetical protein